MTQDSCGLQDVSGFFRIPAKSCNFRIHGLSVSQGAIGKIFGGQKSMLHSVSFLLHRAKEILYEKEGKIVKVRNTVPVLVNHSWEKCELGVL